MAATGQILALSRPTCVTIHSKRVCFRALYADLKRGGVHQCIRQHVVHCQMIYDLLYSTGQDLQLPRASKAK